MCKKEICFSRLRRHFHEFVRAWRLLRGGAVDDKLPLIGLVVICWSLWFWSESNQYKQIVLGEILIINELRYFRNVRISAAMRAASTGDGPRDGASSACQFKLLEQGLQIGGTHRGEFADETA